MNDSPHSSHLGGDASTSSSFLSRGVEPLPNQAPPIRRVRLTLPVLGVIECLMQEIPEEVGPSLSDVMVTGLEWAQSIHGNMNSSYGYTADHYQHLPPDSGYEIPINVADPLFDVSGLIASCPYSRLQDPDFFKAFCRGVIDELHIQARTLIKDLQHVQADPGKEEFERRYPAGATYYPREVSVPQWLPEYGGSREQYAKAVTALDLSKSLAEQQDTVKAIGKLLFGEMPDALWERAWAGKTPCDHPGEVLVPGEGGAIMAKFRSPLWEWQQIVTSVDNPPKKSGAARTRIENGVEVPLEDHAKTYTPEQVAAARAGLAEYQAAVAEWDRITHVYFALFHWARGMDQAQRDIVAVAEQQARTDAQAVLDNRPEHLTKYEADLRERREVGLPEYGGGLDRTKLTPRQIEVAIKQGWLPPEVT